MSYSIEEKSVLRFWEFEGRAGLFHQSWFQGEAPTLWMPLWDLTVKKNPAGTTASQELTIFFRFNVELKNVFLIVKPVFSFIVFDCLVQVWFWFLPVPNTFLCWQGQMCPYGSDRVLYSHTVLSSKHWHVMTQTACPLHPTPLNLQSPLTSVQAPDWCLERSISTVALKEGFSRKTSCFAC